ncbi:MAG: hypothetical protein AB7E72_04030 [Lysobacterales bacterium]
MQKSPGEPLRGTPGYTQQASSWPMGRVRPMQLARIDAEHAPDLWPISKPAKGGKGERAADLDAAETAAGEVPDHNEKWGGAERSEAQHQGELEITVLACAALTPTIMAASHLQP